jgi:hypothetical protein
MLTPNRSERRSSGHVVEVWAMQTETSGGSNETVVNELAVRPTGLAATSEAMAITPVGKAPKTRRSRSADRACDLVSASTAPDDAPSLPPNPTSSSALRSIFTPFLWALHSWDDLLIVVHTHGGEEPGPERKDVRFDRAVCVLAHRRPLCAHRRPRARRVASSSPTAGDAPTAPPGTVRSAPSPGRRR